MSNSIVKAMILAAGEGTRLKPITLQTPKVLLPVGGIPLIIHQLSWLKSHGISEVAINLYHQGEKVKELLGNGSRFGVTICYSDEEALLGTAGGVKRMEHFFDSTFIVVYGDVLTDFDLSEMIQFHMERKVKATIAVVRVTNPWEVGIVEMVDGERISSFVEKPARGSETSDLGNGGVYTLEKGVLNYIPDERYCDFAYDVFPSLMEADIPIGGYVLKPNDYLIDIGTIDKYQKAEEDVRAGRVRLDYG